MTSMRSIVLGLIAFTAMEPLTAATHRFVMHGVGIGLHRSHHRRRPSRFEANDAYPVIFAAIVGVALWIGFHDPAWSTLVPVGVGVTAYGAAYALVHDVYIHRRLRWFGDRRIGVLEHLAGAHELHHRFHGAPYGMLVPIVPASIRYRSSRPQRIVAAPRT